MTIVDPRTKLSSVERGFTEAQVRASIERLTAICGELPECEISGDQHLKVTVVGKTMGWHTVDHHGDGRISLSLRAPKGENEALVASDPATFFLPRTSHTTATSASTSTSLRSTGRKSESSSSMRTSSPHRSDCRS